MKKILILLILLLCSCSVPEKHNKTEKAKTEEKVVQRNSTTEVPISEAYTNIIDTGENRVSNIVLACQKISGLKLNPGEEFSFNKVVGERSQETGYKSAPVIVAGEKSFDIGGGICQVSTTLYMAAKSGGFEITEHHTHSEKVAYAPKGNDATVVYGVKDLKFKNNKGIPVYLYVWIENQNIYSKIIEKK